MNTLKIEAKLAEKYGYYPLSEELSQKYRQFYIDNIPAQFDVNGSTDKLYTQNGTLISDGYKRIVVGDYGAFIEFDKTQAIEENYEIAPGQEYRVYDPKYSKNVKYVWLTIDDNSNIKIYKQKRKVSYADYKRGMFYISPHECTTQKVDKEG